MNDMLIGRISVELDCVPALHPKLALQEHELRYLGLSDDDDQVVLQVVAVAPVGPNAPADNHQ